MHSHIPLNFLMKVFYGSQMAIVAHSVGEDTIGTDKRGMLIKDNEGDYCLVTGEWTGVKAGIKGIPGTQSTIGVPGKPKKHGFCRFEYTSLRSPIEKVYFQYYPDLEILKFKGFEMNLKTGKLTILKREKNVLQNIWLAFSVCIVYLLVQPRPENIFLEETQFNRFMKKALKERSRGKNYPIPQVPPFLNNKDKQVLDFCGWKYKEHIPSNSTLSIYRKRYHCLPYSPVVFWGCGYGNGN